MNWMEMLEEGTQAPCKHGNIIESHACYCHHDDGPRKCPKWKWDEPYEDCELFEPTAEEE